MKSSGIYEERCSGMHGVVDAGLVEGYDIPRRLREDNGRVVPKVLWPGRNRIN